MDTELRRSRKTSLITGNRPWNDLTRMVGQIPSSGYGSGRDARGKIRVTARENHGWISLAPFLIRYKNIFSLLVVGLLTFFSVFIWGIKVAEANLDASAEEIDAARGVEQMFIGQMVDSMRKTVPENEYVEKSQAERIYENLLDSEYSKTMSESGNFGIAELVLAEMKGKR